jgi:hypothetical protein
LKRIPFLLATAIIIASFAFGASAQSCGVEVDGPYSISGGVGVSTYYQYTVPDCGWSKSGPVTSTTLSCSGNPGWSVGNTGWFNTPAQITTSFTVPSQVMNASQWQLSTNIQGSTPDANYYVYAEYDITVVHNGTSTTYSQAVYWNGAQGDDNGCQHRATTYFSAQTGDTIYVTIQVGNPLGGGSVVVGNPVLFNVA